MPLILQSLLPPIASAFAVQTITAIPSVAFRTDRFYDLSGTLTFVAAGAVSLYLPALRARAVTLTAWRSLLKAAAISCNWRQAGLTGLVGIWAVRLGSYLFNRTSYHSDTRFQSIKKSPSKFALAFFTQAIWVSITLTPVLLVNAAPKLALAAAPSVLATDVLGLALWAGGFAMETIADWQKGRWLQQRSEKVHDEEFMTSGLFSKSRFPNYFGEITAWTGVATVAAGVLAQTPVQLGLGFTGGLGGILATTALSFISPAFVATLLLKVSGVPPSEAKYDEKYGDRKEYQEWKKNTPLLVPKPW